MFQPDLDQAFNSLLTMMATLPQPWGCNGAQLIICEVI